MVGSGVVVGAGLGSSVGVGILVGWAITVAVGVGETVELVIIRREEQACASRRVADKAKPRIKAGSSQSVAGNLPRCRSSVGTCCALPGLYIEAIISSPVVFSSTGWF